ncbi:hypothetical protein KP509_02G072900 [Ceratopteris richardii]|uniref:GATA-type domain-containing protein n=1 Tax=Ceratopteris richardii TaxID=49495 RepID=A0A8T2VEA0_CERRI|nr:hypothetical protein KP509_02G072900 [Ceratopteris richardii]
MLPSSSSSPSSQTLARYGPVNHHKKLWLLQAQQLDRQAELQAAPYSASYHGSPSTSNCSIAGATVKEFIRKIHNTPPTLMKPPNGEEHRKSIAMGFYGSSQSGNADGFVVGIRQHSSVSTANFRHGALMDINKGLSLAVEWRSTSSDVATAYLTSASSTAPCPVPARTGYLSQQGIEENARAEGLDCHEKSVEAESSTWSARTDSSTWTAHVAVDGVTSFPQNIDSLRTCTICGTSRTPLWRSGPSGPKSLCNACGIKAHKRKRLQEAMRVGPSSALAGNICKAKFKRKLFKENCTSPPTHKKKKSSIASSSRSLSVNVIRPAGNLCCPQRSSNISPTDPSLQGILDGASSSIRSLTPSPAKNGRRPADIFTGEIEQAAVLLMALSCGLVPS